MRTRHIADLQVGEAKRNEGGTVGDNLRLQGERLQSPMIVRVMIRKTVNSVTEIVPL